MLAGIRSRLTVGLVAPVAALAFAPSCLADQFAVDTTKDGVDANIADDACATANGKCTLRAAVLEANDTDGVDTIQLPARTFKLTRPPSLTAGGALFLSEAVILEGEGARKSVVEQTVNDRVVLSDAAPDGLLPGAILSNLTITGGRMRKTSDPSGGGIRALDHMLLLEDVIVRDNSVRPRGKTNAFGGGVSQQAGRLIVRNSTIRANLVAVESEIASAYGGGLNVQTGELEVEGSTISGNVARQTGSPGRSNGGGILTRVPTTITGSTIAGNTADDGGGIRVADPEGTLELTASTLSGNRAMKGGGLLVANNTADSLVNSTFSGNRITSNAFDAGGAGLYVSLGQVGLAHVTLARNRPRPEQATLEATGTVGFTDLDIRGSVFDNRRRECLVPSGFITTNDLNIYQDNSCLPPGQSTNLVANPELGPLTINPGPTPGPVTKTHALKPSSPALDFVLTDCPPPATDQRGLGRPQGSACDSGSFERRVEP